MVRWPTRKTEELFAFLLCHPGQDISKWQLMDLLWSDMTADRAAHNLHNTIYRLKKILKEHESGVTITKTIEGYMLETPSYQYDVQVFRECQSSLANERLDAFLSVYPLHEEMNLTLLQIYARTGNFTKISKQYAQFEIAYRQEIGVEPPLEIRNWVVKIMESSQPPH